MMTSVMVDTDKCSNAYSLQADRCVRRLNVDDVVGIRQSTALSKHRLHWFCVLVVPYLQTFQVISWNLLQVNNLFTVTIKLNY